MTVTKKKLIEVALPLDDIDANAQIPTRPDTLKAENAGSAGVPPALRGRKSVLSRHTRVPSGREGAGETPALPARTPQQVLDIP